MSSSSAAASDAFKSLVRPLHEAIVLASKNAHSAGEQVVARKEGGGLNTSLLAPSAASVSTAYALTDPSHWVNRCLLPAKLGVLRGDHKDPDSSWPDILPFLTQQTRVDLAIFASGRFSLEVRVEAGRRVLQALGEPGSSLDSTVDTLVETGSWFKSIFSRFASEPEKKPWEIESKSGLRSNAVHAVKTAAKHVASWPEYIRLPIVAALAIVVYSNRETIATRFVFMSSGFACFIAAVLALAAFMAFAKWVDYSPWTLLAAVVLAWIFMAAVFGGGMRITDDDAMSFARTVAKSKHEYAKFVAAEEVKRLQSLSVETCNKYGDVRTAALRNANGVLTDGGHSPFLAHEFREKLSVEQIKALEALPDKRNVTFTRQLVKLVQDSGKEIADREVPTDVEICKQLVFFILPEFPYHVDAKLTLQYTTALSNLARLQNMTDSDIVPELSAPDVRAMLDSFVGQLVRVQRDDLAATVNTHPIFEKLKMIPIAIPSDLFICAAVLLLVWGVFHSSKQLKPLATSAWVVANVFLLSFLSGNAYVARVLDFVAWALFTLVKQSWSA